MKKINDKLKLNETTIARNRIVMPPMDTVAAEKDGKPHSFHIQHYGARAYGGLEQ
jgi:NADPH2 dehydrogenase